MIFLLFTQVAWTQIVLTQDYLPRVGDTLFQAIDNLPSGIEVTGPGPKQRWDFTTLKAPFAQSAPVLEAAVGQAAAAFPSADAVMMRSGKTEFYYHISRSRFELVGLAGYDPLNLGLNLNVKVDPPAVERRAPLRYGDEHTSNAGLAVTFPAEELPAAIMDQLPIRPDSFRLRTLFKQEGIADAWGTLTIPGGIYDVLREKRMEITEIRVEAKLGFLPWQDITGLLPETGRPPRDTVLNYYYFSNEEKEPIAVLTTDHATRQITRAIYKANDEMTTGLKTIPGDRPGVFAFPNPAIVNVRFEFANLPPGEYELNIYNILGTKVWGRRYIVNGARTEKVDISGLRKGTYLYSLTNERGKTITTRRLVVIRP